MELTLQPHPSWLQIGQKNPLTQGNKRLLLTFPSDFLSSLVPAAEEEYKLGLAIGCDTVLLQQEKTDKPLSIKLLIVADLSRLQSAQDDLFRLSASSTLT